MRIWKIPCNVMPLLAFLMPRHEARDAKLQPYRLELPEAGSLFFGHLAALVIGTS